MDIRTNSSSWEAVQACSNTFDRNYVDGAGSRVIATIDNSAAVSF